MKRWLSYMHIFIIASLVSFLVCFPLLLTSCTDEDDDDNDNASEFDAYFPVMTGNIWYFNAFDQQYPEDIATGQAEILPPESFNGTNALVGQFTETGVDDPSSGKMYFSADQHRADLLGGTGEGYTLAFNTPLRVLEFPLSTGKSWSSLTSFTFEGIPISVEALTRVETQETITVQDHTYTNAYRLLTEFEITFNLIIPITIEGTVTSWLAENIGPVKVTVYLPESPDEDIPAGTYSLEVTGTNF
ncbi:hypothetical protein JXQ70_06140 [bacterium]|nr:hypothetical protein [bacterium]